MFRNLTKLGVITDWLSCLLLWVICCLSVARVLVTGQLLDGIIALSLGMVLLWRLLLTPGSLHRVERWRLPGRSSQPGEGEIGCYRPGGVTIKFSPTGSTESKVES